MTPHDWAQLSEWLDGTLPPDARAQLEARLAAEPELAQAATRLRSLQTVAASLQPTADDVRAWSGRPWRRWVGLVLLAVLVGVGVLVLPRETSMRSDAPPRVPVDARAGSVDERPGVDAGAPGTPAPPTSTPTAAPSTPDARALEARSPATPVPVPDGGPMRSSLRPDASTPLALAATLLALSAEAGADGGVTVVQINPTDSWLVSAPLADLTLTPADGVVMLRPMSTSTLVLTKGPGRARLVDRPSDGGVVREYDLRVEAKRDLEFTVLLEVGDRRTVWAPARQRWSIASKATASVTEQGDRLSIAGVAPGETTLEVWFDDGAHLAWPIRVEPKPDGDELVLSSGARKVLTVATGTKLEVEDPTVVKLMPMGTSAMLMGLKAGTTTLIITRDGEVVSRRSVVVTKPTSTEPPPVATSVQLNAGDTGPWRVRVGSSLDFTVPNIESVRTTASFVGTRLAAGHVLVWGSTPGLAVVGLRRTDGSVQNLSVFIDP